MREKLKIDLHILFPFLITLILWIVFYFDVNKKLNLADYGVWPRSVRGIPGIIAHFFIHGNFAHILSNTLSFLVLTLLLFVSYREIAFKVFVWMIPFTGILLWLIGRSTDEGHAICHIGASGVIFSLFGFLLISGLIRKNKRLMALSALIIFLYGYMIWGIFPLERQISWEGHAAGLISGVTLAILFRNKGPQPDKYLIHEEEDEDEEKIPYEEKYWLHTEEEKLKAVEKETIAEKARLPDGQEKNDMLFINYDFIPKPKENTEEDDKK